MGLDPITWELLPPDAKEKLKGYYDLQGYQSDLRSGILESVKVKQLENTPELELKRKVFDAVRGERPDLQVGSPEFKAAVKERYLGTKKKKEVELPARQEALADAGKAGRFESPGSILPTEAQLRRMGKGEAWAQTREQVLADLWREQKIPWDQMSTLSIPGAKGSPEIEKEIADRLGYNVEENRYKAPLEKLIYGAPKKDGESWFAKLLDTIGRPGRAAQGAVSGSMEAFKTIVPELPSGAPPWMEQSDAGLLDSRVMEKAAEYAGGAIKTQQPSSYYDLDYKLQQDQLAMKKAAYDEVKATGQFEVGSKEFKAAVKASYQNKLQSNPLAEYPNAVRFGAEMVLDPSNWFPGEAVVKGIGAAGKAAVKAGRALKGENILSSGIKTAADVVAKAKEGFEFVPELNRLPDSMDNMKSLGRLASDRAAVTVEDSIRKMEDGALATMRKSVKGKANRALLHRALERTGEFADVADVRSLLPPKLQKAYDANLELQKAHEALRASTGVGQDWAGDVLAEPRLLAEGKDYVPRRLSAEDDFRLRDVSIEDGPVQSKVLPGSTKQRTGGGAWLEDPVMQWEAELSGLRKHAKVAQEMKNLRAAASDQGLLYSFNKVEPELLEQVKQGRLQQTGVEWVELQPNLEQTFQRLTGTPGMVTKGDTITLVPKPIAERLTSLVAITAPKQHGAVVESLADFNRGFIQPLTKTWRTLTTIPNLGFHATNAAGSAALSVLSHGLKAADPRLQGGAAYGAFLSALKGTTESKLPFRLRSGTKVELGQILKAAEEDGIVNLFNLRQAMDIDTRGVNPLTRGLNAVNRGLDVATTPFRSAARFVDDYQHLVAYMGFLDGLDDVSRAKAADLTAKFSGNYRRLGEFDQFIKEGFGFYSWMRFVFPHVTSQLLENPQRLAAFVKSRQALERETGTNMPVNAAGVSSFLQGKAVTAPKSMQPEKLQAMLERGRVPEPGSHEFAMMTLEDPLSMGFAYVPVLESLVGGKVTARSEALSDWLGPWYRFGLEAVTGMDLRTGEPIAGLGDALHGLSREFTDPRPAQSVKNLIRLYSSQGDWRSAANIALRYKVGRDFYGLDNLVMGLAGEEGRSIPSLPGAKAYPMDPLHTGLERRQDAAELQQQRTNRYRDQLR